MLCMAVNVPFNFYHEISIELATAAKMPFGFGLDIKFVQFDMHRSKLPKAK